MTEENDANSGGDKLAIIVKTRQPIDTGGGGVVIGVGSNVMHDATKLKQQKLINNSIDRTATAAIAIPHKSDAGVYDSSSANTKNLHQNNNKKSNKKNNIQHTNNGGNKQDNMKNLKNHVSDSEDGFLSTSPDSANGEAMHTTKALSTIVKSCSSSSTDIASVVPVPLFLCTNPQGCVTLRNILDCFKAPISEEQAWALLYQFVLIYQKTSTTCRHHIFNGLEIPESIDNVNVHRDGTVHCSWSEIEYKDREEKLKAQQNDDEQNADDHGEENHSLLIASHKKVLRQLAVIVYTALDFNLQADEQCQMSQELEDVFNYMTADESDDDCIDEGIDEGYKRWDDENDYEKYNETKEFDFVLEACKNHIKPTVPEDHYKAVCRALVTETLELRIFLQQVLDNGANNVHLKAAESQTSQQELAKLGFNDWARFWVQVIDEMRRGVRLKAISYSRAPLEFELTPYEILMEDIRCKKYQLRKVMVNGDIPPRVKKDAHAIIMDFIRSRPPLKKASERKLPPPIQRQPSPREQLMDSIRKGQTLKHVQPPAPIRLKDRLLPPTTATASAAMISSTPSLKFTDATSSSALAAAVIPATMSASAHTLHESLKLQQQLEMQTTPRSKQRLIKVDFSLLQDEESFFDEPTLATTSLKSTAIGVCSQPKMPPYPIGGYMIIEPPAQTTTITKATAQPTTILHQQMTTAQQQQQIPTALTARVLRRTKDAYTKDEYHRFFDNALESYDLATQCESRRASLRRHTIVGCQSNFDETHSMPASRPDSRQSDVNSIASTADGGSTAKQLHNSYNQQQQKQEQQQQQQQHQSNRSQSPSQKKTAGGNDSNLNDSSSICSSSSSSVGPWNKSFMDEKTWNERGDDRLSLTLEEIVHIRSVMTKAELEGLPVGVRVKEDVEKRKVCFLCLRTRFSIFGPWGIQCKLCQRTVCSKCYTKMRIPTEHFRNVPLVLISPSLLASPAGSSTPSPSHHISQSHAHYGHSSSTGNILDEAFPKTLIERLLGSESEQKARNSVGSAPSSPKHQRSNMSTPGLTSSITHVAANQAVEAIHHQHHHNVQTTVAMTSSYTAGCTQQQQQPPTSTHHNINAAHHVLANGGYTKASTAQAQNKHFSLMSRSVEGPRSLPVNSPARPHSNSSTLDRKSKFSRAFTLSSSGTQLSHEQKENLRGEQVPVCNDCKGLVNEITKSGKQKRSSARNRALQNLTLDLSPVWK